ncbi:YraN family protein [Candidatus Kaiserbacteria bacterium]|nr:MAG: YraN family protein [Candidatus Kaiserbacteria bacterium]
MSRNKDIGNTGEHIAARFLETKGFSILGKNYSKKWGELDIIAKKEGVVHFVEVKTISRETQNIVSRENNSAYRAEENMHKKKIERLHRAIQSYIEEFNVKEDWQLDLVTVVLFIKDKKAECRFVENVL